MRIALAVGLLLAACGDDDGPAPVEPDRTQVALVPIVAKHDVDLLFVIDDSPATLHLQQNLKDAFPIFLGALTQQGPLPSLHIGVTSSDLGTFGADDSAPGPNIGSGPGSCAGYGKNGQLLTNNTTLVQGVFIADELNADGTRTLNYTGSLATAFSAIVSLGSSGCGFEQPLEAMLHALNSHPGNVGFVRPDATLAIVTLQDEDDCSFTHLTLLGGDTNTLGPLQSFRCTRFGVTCDVGGATPDEMNLFGTKSECHWTAGSAYLTLRARYQSFLKSIKPDDRNVLFGAIAAEATSLEVEARTPPGGGSAIPAAAHTCTWNQSYGPAVADPAVRVAELTRVVARGWFESVCTPDYTNAALSLAREIRGMLGDTCLTRAIALPADCVVVDQTLATEQAIPACSAMRTTDCFRLIEDAACTTSQHLRVDVTRASAPTADTFVAVRCRI